MDSLVGDRASIPDGARTADGLAHHAGFVAALLAGGDSRIRLDPATATNKYLCPPRPSEALACFASCTASPIGRAGFERAALTYQDIVGASSARGRAARLARYRRDIATRLLRYYHASGIAEAILAPSGTDALMTATLLIASERPGEPITSILPCVAETGSGVPLAATGRQFDGPGAGLALSEAAIVTAEIRLRDPAGRPRPADELQDAYALAVATAAAAGRRPLIYLTHGTKTGLIAPAVPPDGADVIVDACQARIAPETVLFYLQRGWPVVVTGSKFMGGPAFSGAVLLPIARPCAQASLGSRGAGATLGSVLRWTAAIDVMDAFEARADEMAPLLRFAEATIARGLAALPHVERIAGAEARGEDWADLPSIFTFAVRDPGHPAWLLSAPELRALYQRLARHGVLLGQPVDLGGFGGLRIAIGARDVTEDADDARFTRLFDALGAALSVPRPRW